VNWIFIADKKIVFVASLEQQLLLKHNKYTKVLQLS